MVAGAGSATSVTDRVVSQSLNRGVPTLAIHPRDLERGFWPKILRLTRELIETGYEPSTLARVARGERC